jgi:hypothetical protein
MLVPEFRHLSTPPLRQATTDVFPPLGRSTMAHYAIASKAMLSVSASAKEIQSCSRFFELIVRDGKGAVEVHLISPARA